MGQSKKETMKAFVMDVGKSIGKRMMCGDYDLTLDEKIIGVEIAFRTFTRTAEQRRRLKEDK